jgi:chloramphenicol-sensitive protein RarD
LLLGLAAYGSWGFAPLFWKLLGHVPPLEIGAHRVVWGCATFVALALARGSGNSVLAALAAPRTRWWLALSGSLLAGNWLLFIWAVVNGRVLEASFGYFINPLVNVLLGAVVLRERLSRLQWLAVALATAGVITTGIARGAPPTIALTLGVTFGVYGLLRKTIPVAALDGSTVETILILPVGVGYLAWLATQQPLFAGGLTDVALTIATGPVTAIPLLWFALAARSLPLTVMGFLQYVAPSLQFLLAVLVFHEPLGIATLVAFAAIWSGSALFAFDSWLRATRRGP